MGGRKERGINSKYDTFLFLGEKLVVEGNGVKEEGGDGEGRREGCGWTERKRDKFQVLHFSLFRREVGGGGK